MSVVIGRWTGSHRIQVELEDGRYVVVESPDSSADDVEPGEQVIISFDSEGRSVDWKPAPRH
jgi:TOBE domain-containing protein